MYLGFIESWDLCEALYRAAFSISADCVIKKGELQIACPRVSDIMDALGFDYREWDYGWDTQSPYIILPDRRVRGSSLAEAAVNCWLQRAF